MLSREELEIMVKCEDRETCVHCELEAKNICCVTGAAKTALALMNENEKLQQEKAEMCQEFAVCLAKNNDLTVENNELKEILKECHKALDIGYSSDELFDAIGKVIAE